MNIDQNQDNTFTLYTLDTTVTQQFQTQQPSPRNYDPPPQYFTQTTPHNSPQQASSNTNATNTLQVRTLQLKQHKLKIYNLANHQHSSLKYII